MVSYRDLQSEKCSIARSLALVGDRWTILLLREAFLGVRRFDQFQTTLGLSRAVLTQRLTMLVDAGILERAAYKDERRTRHEYRLTAKGADLYPILMALRTWGDKYVAPEGPFYVYRHRGCSGHGELRHVCDTCGEALDVRDVTVEQGPGMTVEG